MILSTKPKKKKQQQQQQQTNKKQNKNNKKKKQSGKLKCVRPITYFKIRLFLLLSAAFVRKQKIICFRVREDLMFDTNRDINRLTTGKNGKEYS